MSEQAWSLRITETSLEMDGILEQNCSCSAEKTPHGYLIANSFLIIVCICTILSNSLFIITVLFNEKLYETPTNKLLLSNAVADLLVGLCVMPYHIVRWVQFNCWSSGELTCKAFQSLDIHMTTMSIFHLTGVAAERYVRIAHPFFYERWVRKILPAVIAVVWIIPAPGTFMAIFLDWHQEGEFVRKLPNATAPHYNRCGKGDESLRPCRCSFWASAEFTAVTTFYQYILPMTFSLFFYAQIFSIGLKQAKKIEKLKASVASNANLHELASSAQNGSAGNRGSVVSQSGDNAPSSAPRRMSRVLFFSKDIQVVRLCAFVLLAFLLCQTSYFVMMFLESWCIGIFYKTDKEILDDDPDGRVKRNDDRITAAFFTVLWLALSNSLVNPILLFALEKNYRHGIKIVIFRKLPKIAKLFRMKNPIRENYMRNLSRTSESQSDVRASTSQLTLTSSSSQTTLV